MKGIESFEPERYYHIVNHAVGCENLFRNNENYRYFLEKYIKYTQTICDTYACCLMPNHFHFLVKIYSLENLSKHPKFKFDIHKLIMQQFSNLLNAYAKAYNKKYNRKGALFMDFTKRFEITSKSSKTSIYHIN